MSLGSVFKKITPWLATAASLTIPGAAPIIAVAAKILGDGLGSKVEATAKGISEALTRASETPEQIAQLKQIDNAFALQMQQLGFQHESDIERIEADDRASARAREIAVKDWTPRLLAYSMLLLTAFVVVMVMFGEGKVLKDPTVSVTIGTVIGYIFAELKQVYNYYFGSSSGSAAKTEALTEIAKGP